jgi:hypothetical protein
VRWGLIIVKVNKKINNHALGLTEMELQQP